MYLNETLVGSLTPTNGEDHTAVFRAGAVNGGPTVNRFDIYTYILSEYAIFRKSVIVESKTIEPTSTTAVRKTFLAPSKSRVPRAFVALLYLINRFYVFSSSSSTI